LVNGQYVASLTLTNLALGAHAFLTTYSGDGNFPTGNSGAILLTITPAATSAALTASANPATANQSVTLTAVVTTTSPGGGNPTGTVNFYNGDNLIGSAALSVISNQSVAKLVTSFSTTGTLSLKAVYAGVSSFTSSTSNTLSETVD
jgi:hypothetical protein